MSADQVPTPTTSPPIEQEPDDAGADHSVPPDLLALYQRLEDQQ